MHIMQIVEELQLEQPVNRDKQVAHLLVEGSTVTVSLTQEEQIDEESQVRQSVMIVEQGAHIEVEFTA